MRTVQLLYALKKARKEEFYKKIDSTDGRWTDEVNKF